MGTVGGAWLSAFGPFSPQGRRIREEQEKRLREQGESELECTVTCSTCGVLAKGPVQPMGILAEHEEATGHEVTMKIVTLKAKSHSSGEVQSSRPFPETYGDWVNLAEEIKQKDPYLSTTVNIKLNVIRIEEGDVDEAKRWLTETAGELNIK